MGGYMTSCCICMDAITSLDCYSLKCGHFLHFKCSIEALKKLKYCPMCRDKQTSFDGMRSHYCLDYVPKNKKRQAGGLMDPPRKDYSKLKYEIRQFNSEIPALKPRFEQCTNELKEQREEIARLDATLQEMNKLLNSASNLDLHGIKKQVNEVTKIQREYEYYRFVLRGFTGNKQIKGLDF